MPAGEQCITAVNNRHGDLFSFTLELRLCSKYAVIIFNENQQISAPNNIHWVAENKIRH